MESGFIYSLIIDPVLIKMRRRVSQFIPPGKTILDVACGTGAQVFELAKKSAFVTGIDHSESMVSRAEKIKAERQVLNVGFELRDAAARYPFPDNHFDTALMSLALHQFSPMKYSIILNEMKRVSKNIILVDYHYTMPEGILKKGVHIAEFLAGKEHFRNFNLYKKHGGLKGILEQNSLVLEESVTIGKGVFLLTVCS